MLERGFARNDARHDTFDEHHCEWLTYRRSAAGARGSGATDKPVCCNALLGRATPPDAIVRVSCSVDDVQHATLPFTPRWRGAMKQKWPHRKDITGRSRTRDVAAE